MGEQVGSLSLVGRERSLVRCAVTRFVKSVGKVCNISRGVVGEQVGVPVSTRSVEAVVLVRV